MTMYSKSALSKTMLVLLSIIGSSSLPVKAHQNELASTDFLAANVDKRISPANDFFLFANGGWFKKNPIPASESAWGIGNVVQEQLYLSLKKINEDAAKIVSTDQTLPAELQQIGDFWASAMDTKKAEKNGIHPLDAQLAQISAIKTLRDAIDVSFAFRPLGIDAFLSFGISQDEKASDQMSIHIWQGGLGLPERDYYFNSDPNISKIRQQYVQHIARTLHLLGRDTGSAKRAAEQVMAFEMQLAKASRKLEDLRDPNANYNKMSISDVTTKYTPSIAWGEYLRKWNLNTDTVVVGQPEFLSALEDAANKTPVSVLQDYLRYQLVNNYAAYLSKAFDDEHFNFNNKILNGQQQARPRWKRVLDAQNQAMGMVLGKIFVKEHFPETAKQRYIHLVEAIRTAYADRITQLDWMSETTKSKAKDKLASITKKVGYPDQWKDYSALSITRDSYANNMMNASRWRFNDMLAKYGKPVDRNEWIMTPQTYNAYYNPSNNEIVLPAAIFLINGVKDAEIDDAVVYGYAGASTIGHEITHGFDDQGRQFDASGNLADWWTTEDAEKFKQQAQLMITQFDAYTPLPGLHINGKASLGENIADYGGILLGIDAFKKTQQFKEGKTIGGYTPMQRYFMGYALGWMTQKREAALRNHLLSDVHAPAKWRVIGPFSNIPDFYQAFDVKPGQPMYRKETDRVKIW